MRVIYVDDEMPALENFRFTVANFADIRSLDTFSSGEEALQFLEENIVDVAFLDMEMPGIGGLELAQRIKAHDNNIRVVFVTAYAQYALEAWGVDATGYVLKPYTAADIKRELAKCVYRSLPSHRVSIHTIPDLSITVDGDPLFISAPKPREMMALLVDLGERGFTVGEGISYLWPDKPKDAAAQSLLRMTWKRLLNVLEEAGADYIVGSKDGRRFLHVGEVECDVYRIFSGDKQAAMLYSGEYLREYSWAEQTNARLSQMLLHKGEKL